MPPGIVLTRHIQTRTRPIEGGAERAGVFTKKIIAASAKRACPLIPVPRTLSTGRSVKTARVFGEKRALSGLEPAHPLNLETARPRAVGWNNALLTGTRACRLQF
jgi:hypothetical protein